jgi:hypothetical protein
MVFATALLRDIPVLTQLGVLARFTAGDPDRRWDGSWNCSYEFGIMRNDGYGQEHLGEDGRESLVSVTLGDANAVQYRNPTVTVNKRVLMFSVGA